MESHFYHVTITFLVQFEKAEINFSIEKEKVNSNSN